MQESEQRPVPGRVRGRQQPGPAAGPVVMQERPRHQPGLHAPLITMAAPAHAATTSITVNGTQGGRTFYGIGAISGGGGNSRLLTGHPAAQQQPTSITCSCPTP